MKLKDCLVKEEENDNEPIVVQGVGQFTVGSLKKNLINKLKDMTTRAQRGDFSSLGDNELEVFSHFWRTLSSVEGGQQPPKFTMFKK